MTVVTCPLGNCVFNVDGVCTRDLVIFDYGECYGNSVLCSFFRSKV